MAREERTARLTILIDPRKKAVFESLCAAEDLTPSQIVRSLIRGYIEERLGQPWTPESTEVPASPSSSPRGAKRRSVRR
ncbi:MAG TPA: CopG family transcriptional regulator [Gammaproteobacteria bacterium]|nr:CopG family transcriptional regulator [Gammaproteobacteria bacterium]